MMMAVSLTFFGVVRHHSAAFLRATAPAAPLTVYESIATPIEELVRQRKALPKHVRADELESEDRIETLPEEQRLLRDTLLMLVYRAETAMLPSLQLGPHSLPDPRAVLKALFRSDACLLPDAAAGTLTVRLHHPTTWGRERKLERLLADLNASKTRYPGTNLRLVYEFAS